MSNVIKWVFWVSATSPCLLTALVLFLLRTLPEDYVGAILFIDSSFLHKCRNMSAKSICYYIRCN